MSKLADSIESPILDLLDSHEELERELAAAKGEIAAEKKAAGIHHDCLLEAERERDALQARLDAPVDLPLTEPEIETWRKWICGLFTRHIFTEQATGNAICDQALAAIVAVRRLNAPCPELPPDDEIADSWLRDYYRKARDATRTLARRLAEFRADNEQAYIELSFAGVRPDSLVQGIREIKDQRDKFDRKLAEAQADADSWASQCDDRVKDCLAQVDRAEKAERKLAEAEKELRRLTRFAKMVDDLGIKICVPKDHPDHPDAARKSETGKVR